MPYHGRRHEDLNVVPYNADLTRTYRPHINVEIYQFSETVAYLMRYAFKPPKLVYLRVVTREERGPSFGNVSRGDIRNYIRFYRKERVMGSVEAS